ncbi:MAG: tRNA pseudouridine(13) synthase TruD [Candidatus Bathyarchaeia archaeon]
MSVFVSKLEKLIGLEVYATKTLGVGGVIRQFVDDFVVEEILVDGSKAEISPTKAEHTALRSSSVKNRFLLCVLVKRNWDTFLALKAIAEQLGVNPKNIDVAGIKDAKALIAQHITIGGATAETVKKVNVKDIEIRPVGYFRERLSSYYLFGNSFQITIRAISHSKSAIKKRIAQTMRELEALGGIPNFFGHQRFGVTRPITHLVGKSLMQGDLRKAVMLFLAKPSPNENPESRQARQQLCKSQNFKQALKSFPKQLRYERLMLKHLTKKPEDFAGAFKKLPAKLQRLFPQAYQSYLFNKFLSKRLANGIPLERAEVGDYVVNVQRNGLPMLTMYRVVKAETLAEINEAIKAGKMRLALPLVGFRQKPSQGVQGEIEKQILEEEGITPENFKIPFMPEISSKGELRTALTPIGNFQLKKVSDDQANPNKNKAKISFTLHRGSYATILLREIIKPCNPIKTRF